MILLEIDAESVAVLEFESDAPRPIHMDREARRLEASQGMKIETSEIHFLGSCSNVQSVQPAKNALMHPGVNLCGPPPLP